MLLAGQKYYREDKLQSFTSLAQRQPPTVISVVRLRETLACIIRENRAATPARKLLNVYAAAATHLSDPSTPVRRTTCMYAALRDRTADCAVNDAESMHGGVALPARFALPSD